MNLVITSSCNKNCNYCFAQDYLTNVGNKERILSLDQLEKILDKFNIKKQLNILGGEPTLHPQFKEIVNLLTSKKIIFSVVSNFIFNKKVLECFINKIKQKDIILFLINITNLDKNGTIDLFSKNYNKIYKILYKNNLESNITCSLTIEDKLPLDYYLNYLDFITRNIIKIENLRLSIAFPSYRGKNDFYFINNLKLGEKVLILTKKAIDLYAKPLIDCTIYPCMFTHKEEWKFIDKFSSGINFKCKGAAVDIFPDMTVSYCFPCKDKLKVNLNNYTSE